MKRGLAIAVYTAAAVLALSPGIRTASAQGVQGAQTAPQCAQFSAMTDATQKKADAVTTAMKAKADRKEVCKLMSVFYDAEASVVKFLIDNQTWCGVPPQMIAIAKGNHAKSQKFRDAACSEAGPRPKAPTLSDAIKTPTVDSATNTKTGRGTFDSLTGNPLAK